MKKIIHGKLFRIIMLTSRKSSVNISCCCYYICNGGSGGGGGGDDNCGGGDGDDDDTLTLIICLSYANFWPFFCQILSS